MSSPLKIPLSALPLCEEIKKLILDAHGHIRMGQIYPDQAAECKKAAAKCRNRAKYLRRKIVDICVRALGIELKVSLTRHVGSSMAVSVAVRRWVLHKVTFQTEYNYLGRGYWAGRVTDNQWIDFEKLMLQRVSDEEVLMHLVRSGHLTKYDIMKGKYIIFHGRVYCVEGKRACNARIKYLYSVPTTSIAHELAQE